MSAARFSIILPAFNGGAHIRKCLRSVLAQTCGEFEITVLDDGSTDGSLEWLAELDDARVRVVRAETHLGIEKNWARAVMVRKAEYMTVLGQDDLLDPYFLRVMTDLIARHPDAALYHAQHRFVDGDGHSLRKAAPLPERETAAEWLACVLQQQRFVHATGFVFRSRDFDDIGGFPQYESLLFADFAFWLAVAQRGYIAVAPDECFTCRLHGESVSARVDGLAYARSLGAFLGELVRWRQRNPAIACVVEKHARAYAILHARHAWRSELQNANRHNQPADFRVLKAAEEAVAVIAPDAVAEIRGDRVIQGRERTNRRPWRRWFHSVRHSRFPRRETSAHKEEH